MQKVRVMMMASLVQSSVTPSSPRDQRTHHHSRDTHCLPALKCGVFAWLCGDGCVWERRGHWDREKCLADDFSSEPPGMLGWWCWGWEKS